MALVEHNLGIREFARYGGGSNCILYGHIPWLYVVYCLSDIYCSGRLESILLVKPVVRRGRYRDLQIGSQFNDSGFFSVYGLLIDLVVGYTIVFVIIFN